MPVPETLLLPFRKDDIQEGGEKLAGQMKDSQTGLSDGYSALARALNQLEVSVSGVTGFFTAGRKLWLYEDTAPTGWSIVSGTGDGLIAVKGGAAAYNTSGGTALQGTWTQPNHLHTTGDHTLTEAELPAHDHGSSGAHTHTGTTASDGAHTHALEYARAVAGYGSIHGYSSSPITAHNVTNSVNPATWTASDAYLRAKSGGAHTHSFSISSSGSHSHSSVGSGTVHNHGDTGNSATANTWRPLANIGIIVEKT